ncbi:MAG: CRISPR-associated endoribonuclease Cas6 [Balneolaceae bacterium]|nr:CRISPR-associated endoribonuclease Cas6 [Balneolaceae bacterium]
MRLHLKLTPNTEQVDFNYQHKLTGTLHKWLGQNDLHDKISLYSFSWLRGDVKTSSGGLNFPQGARWFISFWEDKYTEKLKNGILTDPEVAYGMKVKSVKQQSIPEFGDEYRFKVASPVLIRKNRDDGTREHLEFRDEEVDELMSQRMQSKLKEAGFNDEHLDIKIEFDQDYSNPKTKLIEIKGIQLKANLCPVKISGTDEAVKFAWDVGVGELTGSGFGALA